MIFLGVAALLAFLGFAMHKLKWYFLISGYNTMTEEQQAQVDTEGLGKLLGLYGYSAAGIFLVIGAVEYADKDQLVPWLIGLFVVLTVAMSIGSQRYYRNVTAPNGKGKKWTYIILAGTLVFVGATLYFAMQPTKYTLTEETFAVSGMYGDDIAWSDVEELALVEELPDIAARTNGSGVGSHLKGHFRFEDGVKAKLFVDQEVGVFITFVAQEKRYYLNAPTAEETEALYEQMMKQTN